MVGVLRDGGLVGRIKGEERKGERKEEERERKSKRNRGGGGSERERETERQRDRETERQRDRETLCVCQRGLQAFDEMQQEYHIIKNIV